MPKFIIVETFIRFAMVEAKDVSDALQTHEPDVAGLLERGLQFCNWHVAAVDRGAGMELADRKKD